VLERADGVPLYAVETVRMLVADGRLEPDGEGRFRPTGRLDELEVPSTLQALIAARLDALDPSDRSILQDASVLGKTFTAEALAAVAGIEAAGLDTRLRSLVARELLALDTDPASPERGQYGFVQALIREVAYSTLARRDRRSRHLAAARFFEARGEEELASVLASHYLDAYRAAPDGPEGDAVGAQARIALRAAAERAMALGSYSSVVTYLEQALEIGGGDARDEAELLQRAGEAADLAGQYDRAAALLERGVERWREAGDTVRMGQAIALQGLTLSNGGHSDRALELLEHARDELSGPDLELARAPIVARIGQLFIRRGAGAPALAMVEDVLPIAERNRLEDLFLDALLTKSAALSHMGRDLEGAVLIEGALRRAQERGLISVQMRAMTNAVVQRIDEDPRRAFELGLEHIEYALRYGVRPALVFAVLNTGEIAVRIGEWERADAAISEALALDLDASDRGIVLVPAAMLAVHRGRPDDERYREFFAQAERLGEGPVLQAVDDVRAMEAQLTGAYEEALRLNLVVATSDDLNAPTAYERAGRAALWLGDARRLREIHVAFAALGRAAPLPAAQLLAVEAGALALEGRRDEAAELYREVARRYRDMRVVHDWAHIRLDAARALGTPTPEGAAAAQDAKGVFERLGAAAWLAVLEKLTTGAPTTVVGGRRATEPSRA
jgi:tetratricopeptide (TPR) repeat protein